MSPAGLISLADYQRIWTDGIVQVMQQISGRTYKPEIYPILPGSAAGGGEPLWVNFDLSKAITGHHAFRLRTATARGLAEVLLGEAVEEAPELQPEALDAVGEIFRQFAGSVAVALKGRLGAEVGIEFGGHEAPEWDVGMRQGIALVEAPSTRFDLHFLSDKELIESLLQAGQTARVTASAPKPEVELPKGAAAAAPAAAARPAAPAPAPSAPGADKNVELLLDVELEVTLRFGGRNMLLRDVLELNPGAVLELDRHVQDPVELLVADKVIALGEVVIVDGNYGLRITQLLTPSQRIAAMTRAER